ncbi:acyl-CoA thioesterase II [Frankia sp. AgB32]|uniref:acyl-CoA thioesterase n=1 Tax=Frankia sp. AgB32 TaxID=631119 RepID=UPI00200C0913|nr:acyl-CoA thioesterase domain-containing protein [Frankia sp. AgB32]MCK9898317.1 thioesterase family protein [Frankia sp. AgB32]
MTALLKLGAARDEPPTPGGPSDAVVGSVPVGDVVARELLGLRVDRAAGRGELVAAKRILNPRGLLWGGCGLAAGMATAEEILDRRALWATVQFVGPIAADERLVLELEVGRHGRALTQAMVRGTVDGRLAILVTGTFGARERSSSHADSADADAPASVAAPASGESDVDRQFAAVPAGVPGPESCVERREFGQQPRAAWGLRTEIEELWVPAEAMARAGLVAPGRSLIWLRPPRPLPLTAASLAILADMAPAALNEAIGVVVHGMSLDNSIRLGAAPITDGTEDSAWVLLDAQVETSVGGVVHHSARLFDRGGRLLATASQSLLRRPPAPRPAT